MKDIVGLVAVRSDSTRLPRKAFRKIQGKNLIDVLIDRLEDTDYLDDFIICTTTKQSDNAIEDLCKNRGVKYFRGSEKDVLSRFINASEIVPSKYVSRITGDNPLSDFEQMHKCYRFVVKNNLDYSRPDGVPCGTAIEVIRADALKQLKSMTLTPELTEYMTFFFEQAPFIKWDLYAVSDSVKMPDLRLTVDYEEDLNFINKILDDFEHFPTLEEIVSYCKKLDSYPNALEKFDFKKLDKIRESIKFKEV